jgi:hypothetical protein
MHKLRISSQTSSQFFFSGKIDSREMSKDETEERVSSSCFQNSFLNALFAWLFKCTFNIVIT